MDFINNDAIISDRQVNIKQPEKIIRNLEPKDNMKRINHNRLMKSKHELNLKLDLVWDQTHMVNNYKTCDFYYDMGVKYALLSKEITLDEIKEIVNKSKINCMVEVVSLPSIAYSRRKLLTSYFKSINKFSLKY